VFTGDIFDARVTLLKPVNTAREHGPCCLKTAVYQYDVMTLKV